MVNHKGFDKKPVNQGKSGAPSAEAQESRSKGTGFQSGSMKKTDPMHRKPSNRGSVGPSIKVEK